MPRPNGAGQQQINKGASFTFWDYKGGAQSFSLKGAGGDVSRGDAESLANLIADMSNGCQKRVEIHNEIMWNNADLIFFDEAEASVEQVIVVTLLHDTDPRQNQEFLIPAYDASLLNADMNTVDTSNATLIAAASAALGIVNDDDNVVNPDNYSGWRAYKTIRKVSSSKGRVALNLPLPIEPTGGQLPGELPGSNP